MAAARTAPDTAHRGRDQVLVLLLRHGDDPLFRQLRQTVGILADPFPRLLIDAVVQELPAADQKLVRHSGTDQIPKEYLPGHGSRIGRCRPAAVLQHIRLDIPVVLLSQGLQYLQLPVVPTCCAAGICLPAGTSSFRTALFPAAECTAQLQSVPLQKPHDLSHIAMGPAEYVFRQCPIVPGKATQDPLRLSPVIKSCSLLLTVFRRLGQPGGTGFLLLPGERAIMDVSRLRRMKFQLPPAFPAFRLFLEHYRAFRTLAGLQIPEGHHGFAVQRLAALQSTIPLRRLAALQSTIPLRRLAALQSTTPLRRSRFLPGSGSICADIQISQPRSQPDHAYIIAFRPRLHQSHTSQLTVVRHLKIQLCAGYRQAGLVHGPHRQRGSTGVPLHLVENLGHALGSYLQLLRVVLSEPSCVQYHGPGGRLHEPSSVQPLLRLAGPEEMPFPVAPYLHPCMIVVTVGPEGRIDLAGGNAHAAQGRHSQRRFLPAAAHGDTEHGPGILGPAVRGTVGGLSGAPEIHLYGRIIHGAATGQRGALLRRSHDPVMEESPHVPDVLVVHPIMEHIIGKNLLRHPAGKKPLIP